MSDTQDFVKIYSLSSCEESGLKYDGIDDNGGSGSSLLMRGEWIEILLLCMNFYLGCLSSCEESGLKLAASVKKQNGTCLSSCEESGLKLLMLVGMVANGVSPHARRVD